MRCDVNVSVRKKGVEKFGTRVEIKNINSFRFVEKAVEYEVDRQIDALERGEIIVQETRLWDPDKNRTFTMRSKEDAEDYRYFPDPDLLPIVVSPSLIEKYRSELPELPLARQKRFQDQHGLPEADAIVLTTEKSLADYYEETAGICGNFKSSANWIMTEVLRELKNDNKNIIDCPIKPIQLAEMIILIDSGKISGKIAKTIFQEMWQTSKDAEIIIKEKGLIQISDPIVLEKMIDEVLTANEKIVQDHKSGKNRNVFGFFVGAVMKSSKGQANPEIVNKILQKKLNS